MHARAQSLVLALSWVVALAISVAAEQPPRLKSETAAISPHWTIFRKRLTSIRWVAYAPTHFAPNKGIFPTIGEIRKDLEVLKNYGFTGIVTYGSDKTLGRIPQIAKQLGYQGVIMGIWLHTDANGNLTDITREELQNAVQASKEAGTIVLGYVVGNEGLGSRYSLRVLRKVMHELRVKTSRRVSTSEPIMRYFNDARLFHLGDWIFPIAHGFWQKLTAPRTAAQWVIDTYKELSRKAAKARRFVMIRETGFPTNRNPKLPMEPWERKALLSEDAQAVYFQVLRASKIPFVYFEAFDQPWKDWRSVEPFWGLFTSERQPKRSASELAKTLRTTKVHKARQSKRREKK